MTSAGIHESEEDLSIDIVVVVCLSGLAIGAFYRWVNARYPKTQVLPQSVFVFVLGMLFSLWASDGEHLGRFGQSIRSLQGVHPHAILFVLLPPLLYESAASMDYHVFDKVAGQCLWLAFPIVVIGSTVLASILNSIFPEAWGFDWWNAALLSSILCATDPVAVVASLQVLGAPRKLSQVIDGEALLNDGSAFVLFLVFQEIAGGEEKTLLQAALQFVQLAVGGVAFGVVVAVVMIYLLHRTISEVLEITIIVLGIFGCYFVGDVLLGVSGVLSVVTLGLCMAKRGKYALSPGVEEPLKVFIEQMSFIAVTLIFFITGVVAYVKIFDSSLQLGRDPEAWGYLILLYVILNVLRFVLIFGSLPMLARTGYKVTHKEAIIMVWGGLRGAVGLALALLLEEDVDIVTSEYISFFVVGIVLLTLVINGMTAKPLYNWLEMYPANRYRKVLFRCAMDELETSTMLNHWNRVAKDHLYKYADHQCLSELVPDLRNVKVRNGDLQFTELLPIRDVFQRHFGDSCGKSFPITPIPPRESFSAMSLNEYDADLALDSPLSERRHSIDGVPVLPGTCDMGMVGLARVATYESVDECEKAEQIVHSIFNMIKSSYHHQYDGMELDDEVLHGLIESASIGDESTVNGAVIEETCNTYFQPHFEAEWKSFENAFLKRSPISTTRLWNYLPAAKKIIEFEWIFHSIQGIGGFIRSHLETHSRIVAELPMKLELPLMVANTEKAIRSLQDFERRHARSHGVVKTILAAKHLLSMKRSSLCVLVHSGLLEKEEYLALDDYLGQRIRQLTTCKHDPFLAQIAIGSLHDYITLNGNGAWAVARTSVVSKHTGWLSYSKHDRVLLIQSADGAADWTVSTADGRQGIVKSAHFRLVDAPIRSRSVPKRNDRDSHVDNVLAYSFQKQMSIEEDSEEQLEDCDSMDNVAKEKKGHTLLEKSKHAGGAFGWNADALHQQLHGAGASQYRLDEHVQVRASVRSKSNSHRRNRTLTFDEPLPSVAPRKSDARLPKVRGAPDSTAKSHSRKKSGMQSLRSRISVTTHEDFGGMTTPAPKK